MDFIFKQRKTNVHYTSIPTADLKNISKRKITVCNSNSAPVVQILNFGRSPHIVLLLSLLFHLGNGVNSSVRSKGERSPLQQIKNLHASGEACKWKTPHFLRDFAESTIGIYIVSTPLSCFFFGEGEILD